MPKSVLSYAMQEKLCQMVEESTHFLDTELLEGKEYYRGHFIKEMSQRNQTSLQALLGVYPYQTKSCANLRYVKVFSELSQRLISVNALVYSVVDCFSIVDVSDVPTLVVSDVLAYMEDNMWDLAHQKNKRETYFYHVFQAELEKRELNESSSV